MFVNIVSHSIWVDFTVLPLIFIAWLSWEFIRNYWQCKLMTHTEAPHSAILHTKTIEAVLVTNALAPLPVMASVWIRFTRDFTVLAVFSLCSLKVNIPFIMIPGHFGVKLRFKWTWLYLAQSSVMMRAAAIAEGAWLLDSIILFKINIITKKQHPT